MSLIGRAARYVAAKAIELALRADDKPVELSAEPVHDVDDDKLEELNANPITPEAAELLEPLPEPAPRAEPPEPLEGSAEARFRSARGSF